MFAIFVIIINKLPEYQEIGQTEWAKSERKCRNRTGNLSNPCETVKLTKTENS